ncbi:TPA: KilA-N domain-containing protein [Salmonella enterica subsp. enterica serovar Enteritidis]|nr:KilA-N domain-containing protein [Salmonella enterica subsp. enterica serovar Enteritidis]
MNVQTLEFPYGEVEFTRDGYIDASTLTIQMNRWRFDNGLQPRNLAQILKTDDCKNFMRVCEEETGIVPLKTSRGRNGKTWLCLHLAVYIAEQYSAYFHFLVIDRFITQRQVELRNIGAVSFVELNAAVSRMIERTEGRIGHSGHFIQVAKAIKESIDIREVTGFDTWDSQDAKTNQLRSEIQKSMVTLLDMEAVNSWDELKEAIPRVVRKCAAGVC